LQGAADHGGPCGDYYQGILRATFAEGDHAGNHGDVPKNWSGVGDEEFAVAVEDAEAPGGSDEKACAGKEDAHEEDGEFAFFAVEAGSDGVDEPGSGEDAEKNKDGSAEGEKRGYGTGGLAGFLFVVGIAGEQAGVDGDEGGGEDAFAEKILEEIGDAEGGFENVGGIGIAEVVSEDAVAD